MVSSSMPTEMSCASLHVPFCKKPKRVAGFFEVVHGVAADRVERGDNVLVELVDGFGGFLPTMP